MMQDAVLIGGWVKLMGEELKTILLRLFLYSVILIYKNLRCIFVHTQSCLIWENQSVSHRADLHYVMQTVSAGPAKKDNVYSLT